MAAVSLFAAVLAVSPPQEPERYVIVDIPQEGDRFVARNWISTGVSFRPMVGGQPAPFQFSMKTITIEQYTERITKLDRDNRTAEFSRRYSRAMDRRVMGLAPMKPRCRSYHGRTVRLHAAGDQLRVVSPNNLSAEDRRWLEGKLGTPWQGSKVPTHPLAVGETWTNDYNGTPGLFGGSKTTIHGRVTGIVDYARHRCVRIEVKLESTDKKGRPTTFTGETLKSLDIDRILKITLTGPISLDDEDETAAGVHEDPPQGEVRFGRTMTYLAVAGKPVKQSRQSPRAAAIAPKW
jgi:hypothetical protein